jgi:putative flippase GtrA
LTAVGERWQRFAGEVSKFLAVGGFATIVAFVLFNLLVHGFSRSWEPPLNGRPIVGYVVANAVGMVISYWGTRSWAFRERIPVHADGGRTAYLIITVATLVIPVACLKVSRDVLGLDDPWSDNISANGIGLGLSMVVRFYLLRRFVFRRPPTPALSLHRDHKH